MVELEHRALAVRKESEGRIPHEVRVEWCSCHLSPRPRFDIMLKLIRRLIGIQGQIKDLQARIDNQFTGLCKQGYRIHSVFIHRGKVASIVMKSLLLTIAGRIGELRALLDIHLRLPTEALSQVQ